jgi:putative transposase
MSDGDLTIPLVTKLRRPLIHQSSEMKSIGNKIRPAVQPLERWRLAITGQHFQHSASLNGAVRPLNDDPNRTFTWADVDMIIGVLQVMTAPGAIHGADSVPFVPMNWDVHLWHIAEKITSILAPRDEPPHEGLGYGVNQQLATYEVGFDGKPWTPTEHPSKATRARNCLLGGIHHHAYIERYDRGLRYDWLAQTLFDNIEAVQESATRWLWTYNSERPNMALGGASPRP